MQGSRNSPVGAPSGATSPLIALLLLLVVGLAAGTRSDPPLSTPTTSRPAANDRAPAPLITVAGDRRITKAGGWLRATKLNDPLQLVNVLNGDISLSPQGSPVK